MSSKKVISFSRLSTTEAEEEEEAEGLIDDVMDVRALEISIMGM